VKSKFLVLALIISGCAAGGRTGSTDGGGGGGDPDLAGGHVDLARIDTASAADMTGQPQPDMTVTPQPDMAVTPQPDMTVTPQPDMTMSPADMATSQPDLNMCVPPVAGGTCDTWVQCGCMAGEACQVSDLTTGRTLCTTAGSTNPYTPCTNNASCKAGYACVDSVCKQHCNGPTDCGGANRICGQVTYMGSVVPGFNICSRLCDPVNPTLDDATYDPCGANATCYPGPATQNKASDCIGTITTNGVQGDDCSSIGGSAPNYRLCSPGYICLGDDPTGVFPFIGSCYKFCHNPVSPAATNADCAAGLKCYKFGGSLQYAGAVEIGYCDT
jgi:hypothetical protein